MNIFKHTEVTQHYTYTGLSQGVALVVFLRILSFAARGEGVGYELVGVCRRESPPQASELLMRCTRFPWPLIPPVTLYPTNCPLPHLTTGCEDTVYELIHRDHN